MVKVLMIGPNKLENGGISSVVNSYYDVGLDKDKNLQLTYLDTFKSGSLLKKISVFLKSIIVFRNNIKENDIVHIHMSYRGSFYRKSIFVLMSKYKNKKVIIHIHGSEFKKFYDKSNNFIKKYIENTLNKADYVLALSEEWRENLISIAPKSRVEILHNSIIVPKYDYKNYKFKNILFLGRLGKRKGVYDILKVANSISSKFPDCKFILAGDGEIENVKKICNDLSINNIIIPGWISGYDKVNLLKEATIYILTSYNEGMPISILEAMAYKLPIISTKIGGIPQLIDNGVEGFLVDAGDILGLENSINKLLESEELRKNMGENSFKKVEKDFNLVKNIEKLKSIYKSLIEE